MYLLVLFFALISVQSERDHQVRLAEKYGAQPEVVLWDRSRVDLLNSEYAIEIDFAPKWAEAIGQSLYYAIETGRKPAIVLLVKEGEDRFVYRCKIVAMRVGIQIWVERI